MWDEGSGQVGGVFVFGFPGIAMGDELQGNSGDKNLKSILSLLWVNLHGLV